MSPLIIDFTTFHNIIDGEPRGGNHLYHGISPVTEEELWDAPVAEEADVEDAVTSATKAFPSWSHLQYNQRVELVKAWAEKVINLQTEFMNLSMIECGKPEMIAKYEVELAYKNVNAYAELALPEETLEMEDRTAYTQYMPLGVVACICPWNWPILISMNKMAPALLTGNCVIVKPSPFSPYTTLKLVELGQEFFPPGVLQVLGGDDNLGPWLVEHPKIHGISFTGSIPTGKAIMAVASKTLKRVMLELGGNNATIICPDVDIKTVAPQVVWGAFRNSGQVCVASKRIYIHQDIYDEFVEAMVKIAASLKIGPIQNKVQFEKVKGLLEDCKSQGHNILVGGDIPEGKGYFINPTIIGNPPHDSRIVVEEPFGPLLPLHPYTTLPSAISLANTTPFGLGACIFSSSIPHARHIADQLEAGSVFINSFEKPTARVPMAGWKESGGGYGQGEGGMEGLKAYCQVRSVHVFV